MKLFFNSIVLLVPKPTICVDDLGTRKLIVSLAAITYFLGEYGSGAGKGTGASSRNDF